MSTSLYGKSYAGIGATAGIFPKSGYSAGYTAVGRKRRASFKRRRFTPRRRRYHKRTVTSLPFKRASVYWNKNAAFIPPALSKRSFYPRRVPISVGRRGVLATVPVTRYITTGPQPEGLASHSAAVHDPEMAALHSKLMALDSSSLKAAPVTPMQQLRRVARTRGVGGPGSTPGTPLLPSTLSDDDFDSIGTPERSAGNSFVYSTVGPAVGVLAAGVGYMARRARGRLGSSLLIDAGSTFNEYEIDV